jgi:hypothetical protein
MGTLYLSAALSGGAVVLGHSLGTLRHSVLGELTREDETHGSLDLAGGDGVLLVVPGEAASFGSKALEDVSSNIKEKKCIRDSIKSKSERL